jgi:Transposase DDE domain
MMTLLNKTNKKYNILDNFETILKNIDNKYIDIIRGKNKSNFTRDRKISPKLIFLQMFFNKGRSFKNELDQFYEELSLEKNVTAWGFIKQRIKFNPDAIKNINYDYVKGFYENGKRDKKLKGYNVFAIDGSDLIIPSTEENKKVFGYKNNHGHQPVLASTSVIYDCLNRIIIDTQLNGYRYSERISALEHLKQLRTQFNKKKRLIIFDRGYPSLKMFIDLLENYDKFLFRLGAIDFKREQLSMKSNDEWIDIVFDKTRLNTYRDDYEFLRKLRKLNKINLRFVKVPITTADGELVDEYLITNLTDDEFDSESLKDLYHLRWNIETSYRTLKSSMKLEEFTGYKPQIIFQDIYMSVLVYNIVQDLILEAEKVNNTPQGKHCYIMKINLNYAIGIIKNSLIKLIHIKSIRKRKVKLKLILEKIAKELVPIRNDRSYSREITPVNKCRMSYKVSY